MLPSAGMASPVLAPLPRLAADQARWEHTGKRYDMLTGDWGIHAEARHVDFFAKEVRDFLPAPETTRNAFLALHLQLAILYDTEALVSVEVEKDPEPVSTEADTLDPNAEPEPTEPPDLSTVVYEGLWPILQDNCLNVSGLNEGLVRLDADAVTDPDHVQYRAVPPCCIVAGADPKAPDRPNYLEELRPRNDPETGEFEWTWERWDVRDPLKPAFKVFTRTGDGTEIDRTVAYCGSADYPYRDTANVPIFPYILYHRQHGRCLWMPRRGSEVVNGTLTASALWTMWVGGVRDAAHPQRAMIDGVVQGGVVKRTTPGLGTEQAIANPMAVVQIHSRSEAFRASIDQWQPAMDPKTAAEAIEAYEAGLATYAGLSPSDVSRASTASSGYAIVVSRDGQRKAVQRLTPNMRAGDRLLFATAAKLANAYLAVDRKGKARAALPEDPTAWNIAYQALTESPEERAAKLTETKALLDAGLESRVTAYQKLHPGVDEARARHELAEIDAERAARMPKAIPPANTPPDRAAPTAPPEAA